MPSAFLPVSGSIPSNAVEFLWRPAPSAAGAVTPSAQLYKVEAGQRNKLEAQVVDGPDGLKRVRPTEPVAAGTVLVLESEEPVCTIAAQVPAQVTVSEARPKPSQLGTLRVVETLPSTTLHIPTSAGSCSDDFQVASVRLALSLDSSAQPFADTLRHALVVDGRKRPQPLPTPPRGKWPTFTLARQLEDVLYTLCDRASDGWTNDVSAGSHRVYWLATLPDGTELRSDEVAIQLQCGAGDAGAAPDAGELDASAPDANADGMAVDTGSARPSNETAVTSDAAPVAPDAAAATADSAAAAFEASSPESDDEAKGESSSCSLRASHDRARSGWAWAWLAGLAMVVRRSRRRLVGRA